MGFLAMIRAWKPRLAMHLALIVLTAGTAAGCSSSSSAGNKTKGSPVTDTQTAIVYLQQARSMVAALAQAVVPGATVKQTGSDGPPQDCRAPLTGLKYFSIYRDFSAPSGHTGESLLPAIATELKKQGFITSAAETGGAFVVFQAEKDKKVGLSAMGSPTSSLVRIGVSTQCGTSSPADYDVGIEPTPTPS